MVTVGLSLAAGVSFAAGFFHIVIWLNRREQRAHLAFAGLALSVAALNLAERLLVRAQTPEAYGEIVRWLHVPVFTLVVSLLIAVRLYFGAGRLWLAWTAAGLRLLTLLLNFYLDPNLHYTEITAIRQVRVLGGEYIASAVGVASYWSLIAVASSMMVLLFVADACVTSWRRNQPHDRRRVVVVGSSTLIAIVFSMTNAALIHLGLVHSTYLFGIFLLMIVAAIGIEVGGEILKMAATAENLAKAKASLRQSEQRMEQAAAAGKFGIWEWDVATDEIWVSAQTRELYGLAGTDQIDFARFLGAVHPLDRDAVQAAALQSLENDSEFTREYRVLLPSGQVRWLLTQGRIESNPNGKSLRMRGVSFDISGRVLASERFREVFNAAPSSMIVVDVDGKISLVNARVETDFGYTRAELIGQPIEMLIPERFHTRHRVDRSEYSDGISRRAMARNREVFARHKDGREIPVEVDLNPIHSVGRVDVLASITDISERKRTSDLLKQDQAFLRQVIDINPGLIFAKDREGRFTLANRAVAEMYGTAVEDLIGRTDADFNTNAAEVAWFREQDLEVINTREKRFIAEEHITDAAGHVHWLQTVKLPLWDLNGEVNQVLGTATDITARKQADLDIAQQRNELAHLSRVMMLSELSGSLAHELNQPLAAILSNAQAALRFMARDDPNLDEIRDILRDIVSDDKRAGEVILGLRLLLKKGEMRQEPVVPNDLVHSVQILLRSDLLNGGIEFSACYAADLPAIKGDRVQLQQVLLNLMLNGCEAMAGIPVPLRRLEVITDLDTVDGEEQVRFCIRDRGHGIAPPDLERVFESFFTTKAHGLGLGLAVCRRIITAHGGRMWAANNVEGGASFYFSLPALPRHAPWGPAL